MGRPKKVDAQGDNFPVYHLRIKCDQNMINSMKRYNPADLSVRAQVIHDALKAHYEKDSLNDRG